MNVEKVKQPELAKHDASILDLAFIMDTTGSMGSYIQSATESIRGIVEEIVAMEKSDVRLALVEYRDHPPQDTTFVTRVNDFTESVKEMKKWLENCSAQGGGDLPEAVADGLHDALKLNWREKSTKICVLISDAPPHGLIQGGDEFPNGCPAGIDPVDVVTKMGEKGITLYSVGCEPALTPYKEFFSALAFKTGGQYVPLRNAKLLAKVIVGGAVEEISLERLMEDVQIEVQKKRAEGVTDEKKLSEYVQSTLSSKGVTTNQIMLNNENLEKASDDAIKYSKMASLSSIKAEYKEAPGAAQHFAPMSYASRAPRHMSSMPAPGGASVLMADMAHDSALPPPVAESYSVTNSGINYAQSERLVQKALNRISKE